MTFIEKLRDEIRKNPPSTEVGRFLGHKILTSASASIKSGYHFEFAFATYEEADYLMNILAMFEMLPKLMGRDGRFTVYLKSGECLCNLLALVGAEQTLLELHNEIAFRDLRNNTNRRANFDTANIKKQVDTSIIQIAHITNLKTTGEFAALSPKLQHTANARIENPDATLDELAAVLSITKSGLVNRLRKIMN